jgi:hypothetical protein
MSLPSIINPHIEPRFQETPGRDKLIIIGRIFHCGYENCTKTYRTYASYEKHYEMDHVCPNCLYPFPTLRGHDCNGDGQRVGGGGAVQQYSTLPEDYNPFPFTIIKTGHKKTLLVLFMDLQSPTYNSVEKCFEFLNAPLATEIMKLIDIYRGVKIRIFLKCVFEKVGTANETNVVFSTPQQLYTYPSLDIVNGKIGTMEKFFQNMTDVFEKGGSDWRLKQVVNMQMDVSQYRPLIGRGRRKGVKYPIPKKLQQKGIIIPQVETGCFKYCILIHLYKETISRQLFGHTREDMLTSNDRLKLRRKLQNPSSFRDILKDPSFNIDFTNFDSEVGIEKIDEFEQQNNIGINVFSLEHEKFPVRITQQIFPRHINLVLLHYDSQDTYHFGVLSSLSRFLGKKNHHRRQFCRFCLKPKKQIDQHETGCQENVTTYKSPKKAFYEFKKFLAFQDHIFKFFYKFIYCENDSLMGSEEYPLEIYGYSFIVLGPNNEFQYKDYYCGFASTALFWNDLCEIIETGKEFASDNCLEIAMTKEQAQEYEETSACYYCKMMFTENNHKCRHHNHVLPDVPVLAVCNNCNLQIKQQGTVVIGFDEKSIASLILIRERQLGAMVNSIKIIPGKDKDIKALRINGATCIDFRNFCDQDLATIGQWTNAFPICEATSNNMSCLKEKLAFPRLMRTKRGLLQEGFDINHYTDDRGNKCDATTLSNVKAVWDAFKCQTVGDYMKVFLESQTALLADCVISFTKFCMSKFQMSPLHFVSLPSYAYTLSMYNASEPFQHCTPDIVSWLINGGAIRGGITTCNIKKANSNSEYSGNWNGIDEERMHILSIDSNSNYSSQTLYQLPVGGYEWLTSEEIEHFDYGSPIDGPVCWIFEVDCEIDSDFHDQLNCLPPCPFKASSAKGERLRLDFEPKPNYITDWGNLKYYMGKGVNVTKVHRIMRYEQRPVLRGFMNNLLLHRLKHKEMRDVFGEQILKLIANALIGKFTSVTSEYVNIELVESRRRMLELIAHPKYEGAEILDEALSIVRTKHVSSSMEYPILMGFKILEMSKLTLYRALDRMQSEFPGTKLCGANTDGLALLVPDPTNSLVAKLSTMSDMFDFSNLTGTSDFETLLYNRLNAGRPGHFKFVAVNIVELIYLSAKSYSYITRDDVESHPHDPVGNHVAGGVPKSISALYTHKLYQKLVNKDLTELVNFMTIKKSFTSPSTKWVTKVGFRDTRNGRFYTQDGHSLAFNHIKLQ